jgi:UDP-N-acetylglucosamine--N-acetylmuramyl-(pentapeptide) pyrophosphoryl-undecaprenol N-acetylglucosamine transferase
VFFKDIEEQIKKSHLVIARSGSSSIFELAIAKKPMILVPFANSADNHQQKNADEIAKCGGAVVVQEEDFTIHNITSMIEKLIDNPELLNRMSKDAFSFANLKATENLSKLVKTLCNQKG